MTEKNRHPQDIIAAVRKRGSTLAAEGRKTGFGYNTLYKALTTRFPNAHAVIARACGESRHAIWPEWYGADDQPLFRTRRDLYRPLTAAVPAREAA